VAGGVYRLRVGILFTLYMLYATQPDAHPRVRIRVSLGNTQRV
jgi:hypothetical protein